MSRFAEMFLVVVVSLGIGNCAGDQATIRDCATRGQATMLGGGTIVCTVQREEVRK